MGGENGKLSWQFLAAIGAICLAVSAGAIWLGALSNQIVINTNRITKIEAFDDEVRVHDANTTARIDPIEKRLDRLENWQSAVKAATPH